MYENKEHFIIVYREGRKITYGDYYGFHRHTTTNKYALIGQWVVRDGGEFIDVREPIRTLVEDRKVQLKVQVLGINKDGSLKTSHFERVGRGVVDGSGLNENQLISRFVVVEFTYLHPKFHHRNAEWRVILILEQEGTFNNIKGVVYAKEEEVYRVHSKEFPLDFKVAKTRNSFNRNLELGTSIQFDFPLDGVNVDQYRVLCNQNVSVVNKKVVIQDTYRLDHKTKLMYLDQSYFVFDLSYNLQAYMERLGLRKVNAFFELAQHDSDRVMYVLSRYQPFMEIDSDGFNRDIEKRVGDNGDSVYSANSYDSNFYSSLDPKQLNEYNVFSNNNNIKCYGANSGDTGGDRGRKEAEVVAKIEKCKELIRTAENLISALSSTTIADRLAREAERIRRSLKYLPRDYGTLHHQMSYKELEQEEKRLNESIEHYEVAIKQAVLFLVEQDLVDQKGTAAQVIGCFLADNL